MTAEISLRGSRGWPPATPPPNGVLGASPERSCRARFWRLRQRRVPGQPRARGSCGGSGVFRRRRTCEEMDKTGGRLERPPRPAWLARSRRCGSRRERGPVWDQCARSDSCRGSARDFLFSPARPRTRSRLVALLEVGELQFAEAFARAVDEGDLHSDIGLDVGLAEEREDLASGELFDRLLVAPGHHELEVLT